MIVDTTFLIDLMKKLPEAVKRLEELQISGENIFITAPSVFELWTGLAHGKQPEKEEQKIKEVIGSQFFLDLTKENAEEAGIINGKLWKEGCPIDPEDCMIAGIAKLHNDTILTRNLKHFERIRGISVETY